MIIFSQIGLQTDLRFVKKIYTTEDFWENNLHRKRVIFDIC